MEGTLRCTLESHAQHAHTRSIQQSTSTHTKHSHNIQQQNSNHTKTYCELFHQTIHKHATHKTNRTTHKIQGYNRTLNTTQVQEAIKQYVENTNIIPHIWKLANIVPIPKPNKDIDRPISLLSVIAKTLEKSLLLYITANIPNTPTQHGYKTQHSTVTALYTVNNTVAKGFNQIAHSARTITVALDMSKAFDTLNIHTLIRKVLQTNIPGTIIKFIANYIKVRKAYTTFRNHTSRQRQIKTGVPQGAVLSPTLFNIYTSDLPPPSTPVQVMAYADDITITSTYTSTSTAKKYIQPYKTRQNKTISY